jgi:LysM repeat protein
MTVMFLRTRLHMYLVWSTGVFVLLAVLSGLLTDGGSDSDDAGEVASSTTVEATTTTAAGEMRKYVVQPGESLFAIAQKFNLSAPALVEINKIKNPDRVSAGTELLLPPSNGFVPIGATTTMPP